MKKYDQGRQTINSFLKGTGFLFGGVLIGLYLWKRGLIPLAIRKTDWSIGIYSGFTPLHLVSPPNVTNPVLTARDVTDARAVYVADPFMLKQGRIWFMFFEIMQSGSGRGCIGLAISYDSFNWSYQQVVLQEVFHLSYPYVFQWENDYYMIPESSQAESVRLYKALDFPTRWSLVKTLLDGQPYLDASPFRHNDKWWMFVGISSLRPNDTLHLYYADHLTGPWSQHPSSPIVYGDARIARPAGRIIHYDGRIFRYAQDCNLKYGHQVRLIEIVDLTMASYQEQEISSEPILGPSGRGWNAEAMHTVDAHQIGQKQWIACVDGHKIAFHPRYQVRRM